MVSTSIATSPIASLGYTPTSVMSTSVISPTSVISSTQQPASSSITPTSSPAGNSDENDTLEIIVGSSLGGLCIICLLLILVLCLLLRKPYRPGNLQRKYRANNKGTSALMDKHVSFEEDVEHRVDSAGESEEGKPLDKRTADEATLIRRSSLQQMKEQRDRERERAQAAQLRRDQPSTEESSSVSSTDSDISDSSSASMQPGTVSIEWPQLTGNYPNNYVPLAPSNKSPHGSQWLGLGLRSFPVSGMVYSPLIDND